MNRRILLTIAVKDLKEAGQNRAAWIPALVVPLIFFVLLPLAVNLAPSLFSLSLSPLFSESGPVGMMRENIPELASRLAGLDEQQTWVVLMTGYFFAPFILLMPLMLSTIVGAESFVGEKERKTIEALIYTPATDAELFLGKVLASVLPAVALAWSGFLVYGVVVNVSSWPVMGHVWFPPAAWWPLMLWVTPAIATLGMAVTVLISAKVNTFMEAYQMSASLVVLVLMLVAGQVTGILYLSVGTALAVGSVLWIVDAVLVWLGIRTFARETLLSRL
jgi:ABC-2 type transport system permease protein